MRYLVACLGVAYHSCTHRRCHGRRYFEEKGSFDKAVLLYQKGGKVARALDLCFKGKLFDSLRQIADNLGADTDPAVLAKCGEFFVSNNQFEKAVHLFAQAKQYNKVRTASFFIVTPALLLSF